MTVENTQDTTVEGPTPEMSTDAATPEMPEADADNPPEPGRKKSRFWSRGKKQPAAAPETQAFPTAPISAEDLVSAQTLYQQQLHEAQLRAAQEEYLKRSSFFRETWGHVDTTTEDFAYGIQFLTDIKPDKKTPKDHITLKTMNGTELCWLKTTQQTQEGPVVSEFIGLTKAQAKRTPLNDQIAEDIMAVYKARHGQDRPVTLLGSHEEKDILWLAAMKAGLTVSNHFPSPEAKAKWEEMKTAGFGVTATPEGTPPGDAPAEPETEASGAAEKPVVKSAIAGDLPKPRTSGNRFAAIETELTEERLRAFDEEGLKALGKTIEEECKKGMPAQGTPEFQSLNRIVNSIDARQKEIDGEKSPSSFMREAPATPASTAPQNKPPHREP